MKKQTHLRNIRLTLVGKVLLRWRKHLQINLTNERLERETLFEIRAATDSGGSRSCCGIQLDSPQHIVDLGRGPGNSTELLLQRWPDADVVGVDHSANMIDTAKDAYPDQAWKVADLATWFAESCVDLVYCNAALQSVTRHEAIVPRLFSQVSPGGALAFQIPSLSYPQVRKLIHEISRDPAGQSGWKIRERC